MSQLVAIMCAAAAAASTSAAFTAVSDHEIRVMAFSPAAKSTNDDTDVSHNSHSKITQEAFSPTFDGLQFIKSLVTAHR